MSAQIRHERKGYYEILEATQQGDLDITVWLEWPQEDGVENLRQD
jgi:Fic family protein